MNRIRELADVLKGMTPEQFRQVTVWLRNAVKSKLPETLREEMDRVLEETKPWEVDKMITNIERTLDEMQRQARTKGKAEGKAEGKIEGKVETARAALREGLDVDVVCRITGLSRETVMELKRTLEN